MRLVALIVLAITVATASVAAAAAEQLLPWGSFRVMHAVTPARDFDVQILTDRPAQTGQSTHVRLVRMERVASGNGAVHQSRDVKTFADSSTCPAIAERLSALAMLRAPTIISPFQVQSPGHIFFDGSTNTVVVPGQVDESGAEVEVSLSGNQDSGVARWIDGTMQALEPCWRPDPS